MRLALALALLLVACSSPTVAPRDCTPGQTAACVCPVALASGVQTCTAEGRLGVCVCPDAGAMTDVTTATDRQETPDAGRDAGLDAAEAQADVVAVSDATSTATDAEVCQLRGDGELPRRRCASAADCRGCAELVPGYEWCCGLAGYCENRPPGQCTADAGIYTPDAGPVSCGALDWNPRCRANQDCQAACLPTGVNRVPWCCSGGGCVVSTGGTCR